MNFIDALTNTTTTTRAKHCTDYASTIQYQTELYAQLSWIRKWSCISQTNSYNECYNGKSFKLIEYVFRLLLIR